MSRIFNQSTGFFFNIRNILNKSELWANFGTSSGQPQNCTT